ncbi:MAG: MlaD family protein [Gammaproteobacteria bacterium]
MERDIRYVTVGVTVALLGGMFLAFLLWQAQRYATPGGQSYTVQVHGAVTGVGAGSPVKYLGVSVGRVDRITLAASDLVEVRIRLDEGVPVNASTAARIEPEGITGRSYVALQTIDSDAGPVRRPEGASLPVIPAEASNLDRLFEGLPALLDSLSGVADSLNALLGEDNRRGLAQITANLAEFSASLSSLAARADGLMVNLDTLASQAATSMAAVDGMLGEARETLRAAGAAMRELERVLAGAGELSERLNRLAENNFDRLTAETLPELDLLLRDGRDAVRAIEALVRKLEAEPSVLLHRRVEGGVEIAR